MNVDHHTEIKEFYNTSASSSINDANRWMEESEIIAKSLDVFFDTNAQMWVCLIMFIKQENLKEDTSYGVGSMRVNPQDKLFKGDQPKILS